MVNGNNLENNLKHLYRIGGFERKEIREHFANYAKNCGNCYRCGLKEKILDVFENEYVLNQRYVPNIDDDLSVLALNYYNYHYNPKAIKLNLLKD